jgi:hypothetical protein
MNLVLEIRIDWEKDLECFQLILSFPCCLIPCMITLLYFAHLDHTIPGDPCHSFQYPDWVFNNG